MFWEAQPNYIGNLKRFGETGIVKKLVKENMVDNRGFVGMLLGYSKDHAENTYLMWNEDTKRAVIMRSVRCLDQSFGETKKLKENEICRLSFPKLDEDDDKDYELLEIGGINYELSNKNKPSNEIK